MKYSVETNALAIGYGKAALARHGVDVALRLQLAVRPLDGVGIDGQLCGKAPHGRQLLVRRQQTCQHHPPQAVLHLLVQRPPVPIIQGDHLLSTPFHDVY